MEAYVAGRDQAKIREREEHDAFSAMIFGGAEEPAKSLENDKTTNSVRRHSAARDARFYEERRASNDATRAAGEAETSVTKYSPPTPPTPPTPHSSTSASITLTKPSRSPTWTEKQSLVPSKRTHHVPAPWRDLSDRGTVQELFDTGSSQPGAHAFTSRLNPKVEAMVLRPHKRSTATRLQQRIMHELRDLHLQGLLSSIPDLTFVLEQIDGKGTHLHGVIVHPFPEEMDLVRKAIRRGCGEWKTTRQHQVKTTADPDNGWASYSVKDFHKLFLARLFPDQEGSARLTIQGKPYACTSGLRKEAEAQYEKYRSAFIAAKGGK